MVDKLACWVKEVKYNIGIELMACCEYNHLELLIGFFEALNGIRTNVYPSLHDISIWECHVQHRVRHLLSEIINAMDQCLIEIKYDDLLLYLRKPWSW